MTKKKKKGVAAKGTEVDNLKTKKSKSKSSFTRERNCLLRELESDLPSRRVVRDMLIKFSDKYDAYVGDLSKLCTAYQKINDSDNAAAIATELDEAEERFTMAYKDAEMYLELRKDDASSVTSHAMSRAVVDQSNEVGMRQSSRKHVGDTKDDASSVTSRAVVDQSSEVGMRQSSRKHVGDTKILGKDERVYQWMKSTEQLNDQLLIKSKMSDERRKLGDINTDDILEELAQTKRNYEKLEEKLELRYLTERRNLRDTRTDSRVEDLSRTKKNIERSEEHSAQLGTDLWKHMKRVAIPTFKGDKLEYESWKAAFMACVDQAPASEEYKLLQLKQALDGEALDAIKGLGHSAEAYRAAKERLERRYGGKRRQIALCLERLEKLRPVRKGNSKDLEKFCDLLDLAVINLKSAGRVEELSNGTFYTNMMKKLPEEKLVDYHRWLFDKMEDECVESLRKWVIQETEFETVAHEIVTGLDKDKVEQKRDERTLYGSDVPQKNSKSDCIVCHTSHPIWLCDEFKSMQIVDRNKIAKDNRLCFGCLLEGHVGKNCVKMGICGINGCKERHNRLLHENKEVESEKKNEDTGEVKEEDKTYTTLESRSEREFVALRIVPITVKNGKLRKTINALLDDASTKTYINGDVAAALNIRGEMKKVTVKVLNNTIETFDTMPVQFDAESVDGNFKMKINASTMNKVTGNMEAVNWKEHANKWDHLKDIEFPDLGKRPKVDMLIGMDHADVHFSFKDVKGKPGEPIARLTPLGWTCIGSPDDAKKHMEKSRSFFIQDEDISADKILKNFWEIENMETVDPNYMSKEDRCTLQTVKSSKLYVDGKYQVAIPWKPNKDQLKNNYEMAYKRLLNTEKRLFKEKDIADSYVSTIEDYKQKGYIKRVQTEEVSNSSSWYLPHFPVIRKDKTTTKVRIVFDAAAKFNGLSLNDTIYQGPKLQKDLCDILMRFRRNPVALVCDIQEMYLRIGLAVEDRRFHRFLWRNLDVTKSPEIYEFNSIVFGVTSSPFEAQLVAQDHAEEHKDEFPLGAETVLESTYMDDNMDSVEDEKIGIELYEELSQLWKLGNMHARKWLSNSAEVLENIPVEDRAKEIDLSVDDLPSVKTLGLMWRAKEDVFTYNKLPLEKEFEFTKRNLLRKIASLFDPLGFLSPYITEAKLIMQDVWLSGVTWDERLLDENAERAKQWFSELEELPKIKVPRCFHLNAKEFSIHVFTDSSEMAYGAVAYSRYKLGDDEIETNILMAKSRVAPLKSISVPRLELCGAMLGLDLGRRVSSVLKVSLDNVIFWVDSMNVLFWIRNQSRAFKPFVANRLGMIHSQTKPSQWRYVPSGSNSADMITRGKKVVELVNNENWWIGPEFLRKEEIYWPVEKIKSVMNEEKTRSAENEEKRKHRRKEYTYIAIENVNLEGSGLNVTKYSSWIRITRILAWMNRFMYNIKVKDQDKMCGELTPEEIKDAEICILKETQKKEFGAEYNALRSKKAISANSQLLPLYPQLDEDGLMRANGRLKNASFLPYDTKYPIILPRKNWITKLLVKWQHENDAHIAGTNHTLASLSSRFWLMQGREEIRDWEKECNECRRRKAKQAEQIMAPLPKIRLKTPLRAFSKTAVDYAGPFITIQGRGKARQKRYLCLFNCLLTRAVHLEIAFGLDTDKFLNAMNRMMNRRGIPDEIISDNGTNFVGANNELQELLSNVDEEKIKRLTSDKGINWEFNPPQGAHFGGVYEIMIKAAKRAVYAILSNADINDEELMTAFTGAEALINSRPLTYQSANPLDDVPLTPNHFLHGQLGGSFAPEIIDDSSFSLKQRWRRVQELMKHFWSRWMKEWLPSLNSRKKWQREHKDIKNNDVVLVVDPDTPRGQWKLGRVTQTLPGKDGHVRVVKVQVGGSLYTRPISKICPLEIA